MLSRLLRSAASSSVDTLRIAQAIFEGILGRKATAPEIERLADHITPGNLGRTFEAVMDSAEFHNRALKLLTPRKALPDLRAMLPDHFTVEQTDYGESILVFRGSSDADFDRLEELIHAHGYYDLPNVWAPTIDLDKKVTAAVVRGLGARSCLELGCFTGAVLKILGDFGIQATGLDLSHLAFAFAMPGVRHQMIFGDLLSAELAGPYDVVLAMDMLEHLNPSRLGAYIDQMASLLSDDGYLYINSPMFGEDDVFGTVFPPYLKEWQTAGDTRHWRHLDCDEQGWPKHGHLVWASPAWWEQKFRESGLVRDREIEAAIHQRLANFFSIAPARKCFFVLKRDTNRRSSQDVGREICESIDAIGEVA